MSEAKAPFSLASFAPAADDPLIAEHQMVSAWVEAALAQLTPRNYFHDLDLKSAPAGQAILDAKADAARKLVVAAVAQAAHWDAEAARVRSQGKSESGRSDPHSLAGWEEVRGCRRQCEGVISALMRRSLPFTEGDLVTIVNWCNGQVSLSAYSAPIGSVTRALQRFAAQQTPGEELRGVMRRFAEKLRASHANDAKRLGTTVEQLVGDAPPPDEPESAGITRTLTPAAAGNPTVLLQLKRHLGLAPADDSPADEILPDHFRLRRDSPLQTEHALLTALLNEVIGSPGYHTVDLQATVVGREILAKMPLELGRLLLAAAERCVSALLFTAIDYADHGGWQSRSAASSVARALIRHNPQFDREGLFDYVLFLSACPGFPKSAAVDAVVDQVEAAANQSPLSEGERFALALWRNAQIPGPLLGSLPPLIKRLNALIADGAGFFLVPDDQWSQMLNEDIRALPEPERAKWITLLKYWLTATAARPSAKWLKNAKILVDELGEKRVADAMLKWLSNISSGRALKGMPAYSGDTRSGGDIIQQENADCLRGMLWTLPALKHGRDDLARVISTVAQSAYRKIPGVGPRAVKVGNAAVYALSELGSTDAVGQLAMLKVRVKFGTAQKEIEKAFTAAAESLGLPRDQIEEMGVPTYGLEEVGIRRETFGDFTAQLRVSGRDVSLAWAGPGGKALKSVPAKVKAEHKEDLKELQGAAKDIAAMLPAQSERLDAMFLQEKSWPVGVWMERYLNHPLIGTIARRLIWVFKSGAEQRTVMWHDGRLVNVDDEPIEPPVDATVALWHPIGQPLDDVLSWRGWLERHQVRQPFKQAHREVYLLTDAERRTATYSNRFAAHVLRQHQFNALCAARGWKNKLRLMVDDAYPPASRELPHWGLRAEYWIEGIGDGYGQDTNESGAYLRVATDQVRFYRTGAADNLAHAGGGGYTTGAAGPGNDNINTPLPLDQIPALVLSEILRDVDLFVGVASVGNDPAWQDGGPGGRFQTYWQQYSFGDLSATAQTRKSVLQTLLPRLSKIRDRCSLDEKFLIVRGDIRTYKIHLGSGNILMEPNDQYLCIVPDRSAAQKQEGVFLPFEGDATLSIILSKAFLLASDTKITDLTITRQIKAE